AEAGDSGSVVLISEARGKSQIADAQSSGKEEVLSHDADLLREFAASRRFGLHHDRVRRDRAIQADVWLRRCISHGYRRAWREYRAGRGKSRHLACRARRPQPE